ncbi:dihydrofolate reductase family protein [Dactylosporangium sp. CS-033363]|uniref:dihydrofolate reductase family protein n=1 Tax=Dactylosporangium sp. CS-033363 TaxID=3239935 RepID=UPI003D8D949C
MKIVAGLHVSLDGVVESPERWSFDYFCPEVGASIKARRDATELLLLGRNTYREFAAIWPGQQGEVADFMNGTPKLVASTTLTDLGWGEAALTDLADLRARKDKPGGNITVTGSATLVRSLVLAGLADELHLMVCPVVLGAGKRLFDDVGGRAPLRLLASETFPTGVAHLTYGPA